MWRNVSSFSEAHLKVLLSNGSICKKLTPAYKIHKCSLNITKGSHIRCISSLLCHLVRNPTLSESHLCNTSLPQKQIYFIHNQDAIRSCSSSSSEKPSSRSSREELQHAYHSLLKRLTDLENATRFYGYSAIRVGLVLFSLAGLGLYLFREHIRENVAGEVSSVATKSLGDEAFKLKTHELAVALLYTIFNDQNMQEQTVKFLQDILHRPATQKALIDLLVMVFNEDYTLQNLTWLLKKVLVDCLDDENFRKYLTHNLKLVLEDDHTKQGLLELLEFVFHDEQIIESAKSFVMNIVASKRVQIETTRLGKTVLQGVVKDPTIQQNTGNAIWSAVGYSVTPRWFVNNPEIKKIKDSPPPEVKGPTGDSENLPNSKQDGDNIVDKDKTNEGS